jgi:hypothetical protein
MMAAADDIRLTFAARGNCEPYLGEGWHGPENTHRWTDGQSSTVKLPPLRGRPWFALTMQFSPLGINGLTQRLTVLLNGAQVKRYEPSSSGSFTLVLPGALVRADGENILSLDHPDAARPSEIVAGNSDSRMLALAFQSLELTSLDEPLFLAPHLLAEAEPPATEADARVLVEQFQSLGKNCDLGMLQRRYGAEPFGLLRFAAIRPEALVMGLKTRFAGIGDVAKLRIYLPPDGQEYSGRHDDYQLDYHTFKNKEEIGVDALAASEAQRLNYLARLLIEQLENDEKIFLRHESFDTPGEALTLHRIMRGYNPQARLLLLNPAPDHAPERAGRVLKLRGGLYRGYLSRAPEPTVYEQWLKLCATVVAHERARADARQPPLAAAR